MSIATSQRVSRLILAASVATVVGLVGCGVNLLPMRAPGWEGSLDPIAYCNLSANNAGLVVIIKNIGREDAPATTTRVTFTSLPTGDLDVDLATPAIAARQQAELAPILFDGFPSNCFQPDCDFTITADVDNVVEETSEVNTVTGYCPG